jgi:hypothetical protein
MTTPPRASTLPEARGVYLQWFDGVARVQSS